MSDPASAAVMAGAGRLFGTLAATAARKLARHVTFRWRVAGRVRKSVDFSCRWRTYRLWLKGLTEEELAQPVESIHGTLAKRLDEQLSEVSKDWRSTNEGLSRALRLVELTYPAIAAALGDAERTQVSERWAQERSAEVRRRLLEIAGPGATMSDSDLASVFQLGSEARREVRLQAFELAEEALGAHFDQIKIPCVPNGELVVLHGDFGSGKSEAAESWHRTGIKKLMEDDAAPFPLWLSARELHGRTIEIEIERQIGHRWRSGRGVSIVIDGLDEIDPSEAQTLLDSSRRLVRTNDNVRVLLTARPGILAADKEEVVMMPLSEDAALELVELAGGGPWSTSHWTEDMRATVTRPFFALAAGAMLRKDGAPRREADLIRALVENALQKSTERAPITSSHSRSVLTNLAVGLTKRGSDGLSFSDRQVAHSSRLVAEGSDGSIRFSLPIFQHWFAAQAILEGEIAAEEVINDARSFERWRWAAAVAALSARSHEVLDDLVETWVAGNPGAASWILKEAFGRNRDGRFDGEEPLDPETSGARMLRALRVWIDSLGNLAIGVLPQDIAQGPIGLGVSVSGRSVGLARSILRPATDSVTVIPPRDGRSNYPDMQEWRLWHTSIASTGDSWPWVIVQSWIARETINMLSSDPFLGEPDGVWAEERRFDVARSLLDRGSLYREDLPVAKVVTRANEYLGKVDGNLDFVVSLRNSKKVLGQELSELVAFLEGNRLKKLKSSLPGRDCEPNDNSAWNLYSPQRLIEFELEVYGAACEAYDEAMANTFDRLGWSMPTATLAPFGVIIEMQFDAGHRLGNMPGMWLMRVPMAFMSELAPSSSSASWSSSKRAVAVEVSREDAQDWERHSARLERIRSWLVKQRVGDLGGLSWVSKGIDEMGQARPACAVAADWLSRDLQRLGLCESTFRRID